MTIFSDFPRLPLKKMPLGTSGYFLKGQGVSDPIYALLTLTDIPTMDDAHIPNVETLSYGGAFALAQIPTMDDAHIPNVETLSYGAAFALAQIPRVDLTKIPLGTSAYFLKGQGASDSIYALLTAADVPSLAASIITSGTFGNARLDLSALAQNVVTTGKIITSDVSDQTITLNYASYNSIFIRNYQGQLFIYHGTPSGSPSTRWDDLGNLVLPANLFVGSFANTTTIGPLYATAYGQLGYSGSSIRFKENVRILVDCSWIYRLNPVMFDWRDKTRTEKDMYGLIAEEVNELVPQFVWLDKDGIPEGIHYEWLGVPLIVELKRHQSRLEELEIKIAELEKERDKIKQKLGMN